ncbi:MULTISPECIES: hypothetical protein [Paenibacillus]|uniref:hypothetical protein n=1 Tax=Paenibacillus TaxID=44249 RepID=UPI0028FC3288|nr:MULTISPECIES: hypothetical protein [Paenibacillus]MEC0267415.1 hypothetical protein [Paenibacillus anseongense]
MDSKSCATNESDNESTSNNTFDYNSALMSTANGLASSANNSANTVSNGNSFTVGNSTLINFSDNTLLIGVLLLLAKNCCCQPVNGSNAKDGCNCGGSGKGLSGLEGLVTKFLEEEREKKQMMFEILKQNNSIN